MTAQPYKIQPPNISSGSVYLFTTDSGIDYEVRFARKKDNILHTSIAFGVTNEEYDGEEYVVVNHGEVYRVMNTVVKVIQMYMKEHPHIRFFEYTGEPTQKDPDAPTSKRMLLYSRYLPRIFGTAWTFNQSGNKMMVTRKERH